MSIFFVKLFVFAVICFIGSLLVELVFAILKKLKAVNVLKIIAFVCAIVIFGSLIATLIAIEFETISISTPKISTVEKEFFYISKMENTDVDLGMFSLIIFGEIDGKLTSTNDFIVFYRSPENELIEERIEGENSKFIIVENAEDEKIVIENHTYYEQQNYYSPPKIEEDYVETHYKLYVTEKTFKEIFE